MAADTATAAYDIELVSINGTEITTIPFEALGPNPQSGKYGFSVLGLVYAMEQGIALGQPAASDTNFGLPK